MIMRLWKVAVQVSVLVYVWPVARVGLNSLKVGVLEGGLLVE